LHKDDTIRLVQDKRREMKLQYHVLAGSDVGVSGKARNRSRSPDSRALPGSLARNWNE
ncbi:hypothetical protein N303_00325, partial [Cuculus canorus]